MQWSTSDTISAMALLVSAASALYAYRTFKATVDLKKSDMLLQLETANETLRMALLALPSAVDEGYRSRRSIFVAHGSLGGSESRQWDERVAAWRAEIATLDQRLPSGVGLDRLGLDDLRAALVETHGFQARASAIQKDLDECRRQDDLAFVEFRADQRATLAAKLAQKG